MKKCIALLFILCLLSACAPAASPDGGTPAPDASPESQSTASPEAASTPVPTVNNPNAWKNEEKNFRYDYDWEALSYDLVWSDEFDYEGKPDSERWNYDVGGHGWGNNELQYYTEGDNAYVNGEALIIEARAEEKGGMDYTSTRLISKNKGDWLYGRIEVSAKLPQGLGTWPAIWMLPTDWEYGDWPDSGEIDIMEHVGYDPGRVHATVHTKAYNHMVGTQLGNGGLMVEDVFTEFHVYGVEWLPDRIIFSIDGEDVYEFCPKEIVSASTYRQWPFDQRFHLLINIALGGNWGGAQGFDPDMLPVTMEIDYVRVYQSPEITALTAE